MDMSWQQYNDKFIKNEYTTINDSINQKVFEKIKSKIDNYNRSWLKQ